MPEKYYRVKKEQPVLDILKNSILIKIIIEECVSIFIMADLFDIIN
jgi:hypothetical protein